MCLTLLTYWFTIVLKAVWLYCLKCKSLQLISNVGGLDNMSLLKTLDSESTAANGNRLLLCSMCYLDCMGTSVDSTVTRD